MDMGRIINKGLERFGIRLSRVANHRSRYSTLSSELARETELVQDMTRFRDNDLRQFFLKSIVTEQPVIPIIQAIYAARCTNSLKFATGA